jgi:hypothetical protein
LDESNNKTWEELEGDIGQPWTWEATDFHGGATIEYRTQTDSDGSYGDWKTFTGPFDGTTFKQIQFRIKIDVRASADELRLRQFHPILTTKEKILDKNTDSGLESFSVGTTNTTVTFSNYNDQDGVQDEYYSTPEVMRAEDPESSPADVEVNNASATSVDFKEVENGSAVNYDIKIIGY